MLLKTILSKFKKNNTKKRIYSNDSYCYSQIIWSNRNNLIILISYTTNYCRQIIDIQDAINNTNLYSKVVLSSYDKEIEKKDEEGNITTDIIIYDKQYLLIGGAPSDWQKLYMNINSLGNEVLNTITNEILNNCDYLYFKDLINDGILFDFIYQGDVKYHEPKVSNNGYLYTDPEVLLNNLPNGFTGRDLLKFIKVMNKDKTIVTNALSVIETDIINLSNEEFKKHDLYPIYNKLFRNVSVQKLCMVLNPLYKQTDDDVIPGDVSDELLDDIFRKHYERFSAVVDNNIKYEDIDEKLKPDEETENMHERDKINGNEY